MVASFLIGMAVSTLLTIPAYRPNGVPLCYLALAAALGVSLSLCRLRIPRNAFLLILLWALPAAFAALHGLIFEADNVVQIAARNGAGLLAAIAIVSFARQPHDFLACMFGMLPLMLLDAGIGVGQYYNSAHAFQVAEALTTTAEIRDRFAQHTGNVRIWGVNGFSHSFAYTQTLWAFLACWAVMVVPMRVRLKLVVTASLLVSVAAVIMTGQRSAVWALLPAICALLVLARGISRITLLLLGIVLGSIAFDISGFVSGENTSLVRLWQYRDNSQAVREDSWREAWRVIEADPFWGSAFSDYDHDIAIHNGLLNGWSRFGIFWLFFWLLAAFRTMTEINHADTYRWSRWAALLLVGLTLANMMFHTFTPGINDIPFLVCLGMSLALLRQHSQAVSRSQFSPANKHVPAGAALA
jgi:hypothetical protein